jgi:hypothetical protein
MIRTTRGTLLIASIALALTAQAVGSGCSGPYAGAPEKLKRPSKKARPPEPPPVEEKIVYVEECKTKFQEDASKVRRRDPSALIAGGDSAMQSSDQSTDPAGKASLVVDAINKYKNALAQDPYSAKATYQLAVAYALLRQKGCALALLKRLTDLQKHPDFEKEATRMVKSVDDEGAFRGFHKDALTAAGQ